MVIFIIAYYNLVKVFSQSLRQFLKTFSHAFPLIVNSFCHMEFHWTK